MPAPKHARQTDRGGRSYIWPPTGENFPSVTTILNAMAKPALVGWGIKMVAQGALERFDEWIHIRQEQGDEAAVRYLKGLPYDRRDKAADAGSAVHAAIEASSKGVEAPTWPTLLKGFRTQFERFLEAYRPTWVTSEATVFSRKGYAGTLDAIADIGGRRLLIDVKSGERIYDEVALQLSAYRYADWIDLGDSAERPVPKVDACAVLHIRPLSYQLVEVTADEAQFVTFLHLIETYRWMEHVKAASLIGEMVTPVNLTPAASAPAPSLTELLEGIA
jgi:hypothetical protein